VEENSIVVVAVKKQIGRLMCPILKKLSNKLQPYREVKRLIIEIVESKKGKDIRVLEHLLSFAEY
jgi:hypothetical protein